MESAENKIEKNQLEQLNASIPYVYGAHRSLSLDTNKSPNAILAQDLTGKSLAITGTPNLKDTTAFNNIVDKKLSTNDLDIKEAERLLKARDAVVIKLQSESDKLLAAKDKELEKFKAIAEENASKADIIVKIQRIWAAIKWFIIGLIIFRIVGTFIPPPYNALTYIFDYLLGGLWRVGSKILPHAATAAGVVSHEVHKVSEETLKVLVDSIQEAKQDAVLRDKLDLILKNKTDKHITRPKIIDVKKQLGHI